MATHIGRLDRQHFWVSVATLFILRHVFSAYIDPSIARHLLNALTFLWLLVIIARFHDFGWSVWVSGPIWLATCVLWPLSYAYEVLHAIRANPVRTSATSWLEGIPPEILLQILGPALLVYMIAGCIPGHRGDNRYGPQGQGWNGLSTEKTFSATDSALASEHRKSLRLPPLDRRQTI